MDIIVDARGQLCPKPLILTKKALKERLTDEPIIVLIDNETSKQNVVRFLLDNKIDPIVTKENGHFQIFIGSAAKPDLIIENELSYCTPDSQNVTKHAIVFRSNMMGNGPQELGEILIKAFVNSIKDVTPLPGTLAFYNSGIHLVCEGSNVVDSLIELQSMGVKILVCGTCIDYFQKRTSLKVGTISNMYSILEELSRAHHVVSP